MPGHGSGKSSHTPSATPNWEKKEKSSCQHQPRSWHAAIRSWQSRNSLGNLEGKFIWPRISWGKQGCILMSWTGYQSWIRRETQQTTELREECTNSNKRALNTSQKSRSKANVWGWRDGSGIKSIICSSEDSDSVPSISMEIQNPL